MSKIISGRELATKIKDELKIEIDGLEQKPTLAVIIVGENPASQTYVKAKEKSCEFVGINSIKIEMPELTSQDELLYQIKKLNDDLRVDGILVQLPLPTHINESEVIKAIRPDKDVDGFHPINIGKMMVDEETFIPCTPYGILEMIKSKDIKIEGKHVVVIGRSNIVGKPVGQLFLNEGATVTYVHSKTVDIKNITRQADILIVAVGKPKMINNDYIKDGVTIIDVGINRVNGKICGDVDFDGVIESVQHISPVPNGVGQMTIAMLMKNTLKAYKNRR